MSTIGVIQPNYLPWRGYFDFIHEVDTFVFLDDVQYTVRDWRNRNRIKTPEGELQWLSVPVVGGRNQLIRDVRIDPSQPWVRRHLGALERSYAKAPFFREHFPAIESVYAAGHELLSDLTIALTETLCRALGIATPMLRSSTIASAGSKDDKLLGIVQGLGGSRYLSGPSAQSYMDPEKWARAGVELAYKDYSGYPAYAQLAGDFEPAVSIVDLLFLLGPESPDYIWGRYRAGTRG